MSLEILTPLSKGHRVSRKIDSANFTAVPGIWGYVDTNGTLNNFVVNTPQLGSRMVISNASTNEYESHDIEVNRISTLESPGFRCKVDTDCYVDSVNVAVGLPLVASVDTGNIGKLAVLADITKTGDYEIVARVEEFDATNNLLTFLTVSPTTVAKS